MRNSKGNSRTRLYALVLTVAMLLLPLAAVGVMGYEQENDLKTYIDYGADRVADLQADTGNYGDTAGNDVSGSDNDPDDAGWDWDVTGRTNHSTSASSVNLYGITAWGLLSAYKETGTQRYLDVAKDAGDYLVYLQPSTSLFYEDSTFLYELWELTGDISYYNAGKAAMNYHNTIQRPTAQNALDRAWQSNCVTWNLAAWTLANLKYGTALDDDADGRDGLERAYYYITHDNGTSGVLDSGDGLLEMQSKNAGAGKGLFLEDPDYTTEEQIFSELDTGQALVTLHEADKIFTDDWSTEIKNAVDGLMRNQYTTARGAFKDGHIWNTTSSSWQELGWEYWAQTQAYAVWGLAWVGGADAYSNDTWMDSAKKGADYLAETWNSTSGGWDMMPDDGNWTEHYNTEHAEVDSEIVRALSEVYRNYNQAGGTVDNVAPVINSFACAPSSRDNSGCEATVFSGNVSDDNGELDLDPTDNIDNMPWCKIEIYNHAGTAVDYTLVEGTDFNYVDDVADDTYLTFSVSWTVPDGYEVGTHNVKLTVTDDDGASVTSTTTLTVTEYTNVEYLGIFTGAGIADSEPWGKWNVNPGASSTDSINWLKFWNQGNDANDIVTVDFTDTVFTHLSLPDTIDIDSNIHFFYYLTNGTETPNAPGTNPTTTTASGDSDGAYTFTFTHINQYLWVGYTIETMPIPLADGDYRATFTVTV